MIRRIPAALSALAGCTLASALAAADPCALDTGARRTPIAVTTDEAHFATTPSPCGSNSIALEGRGSLLIARSDYYGLLLGEALLSGSMRLGSRVWLTASVTALQYHFAQDATFVATQLGLGPSTLAIHGVAWRDAHWQLSTYVRALLPTTSGEQYAALAGVEPGASAVWALSPRASLFAGLSLPVTSSFVFGDAALERAHATLDPRASLDAAWSPWPWLEGLVGAELRFATDASGPLEYLAPKASLRLHAGRHVAINLAALFPLLGTDRTLVRGSLGVFAYF